MRRKRLQKFAVDKDEIQPAGAQPVMQRSCAALTVLCPAEPEASTEQLLDFRQQELEKIERTRSKALTASIMKIMRKAEAESEQPSKLCLPLVYFTLV